MPASALYDLVPPGAVHLIVRTPLGTAVVDPFTPERSDTARAIMDALGIEVELRLGPVPDEDLAAPGLGEGLGSLLMIGGVIGAGLYLLASTRRTTAGKRRVNAVSR